MIGVIDYQTGNPQSVSYALRSLGLAHRIISEPDRGNFDRYILPGVGSADTTMTALRDHGWIDFLSREVVEERKPFLGICIGLQVLFEHSEEGDVRCLGWLEGDVRRFDTDRGRIPHMGWNTVRTQGSHPILSHLPDNGYFYFVNSYYVVPSNELDIIGSTDYSGEFAAVVARGNIMATQFHTEKSGELGLGILAGFAELRAADLVAR